MPRPSDSTREELTKEVLAAHKQYKKEIDAAKTRLWTAVKGIKDRYDYFGVVKDIGKALGYEYSDNVRKNIKLWAEKASTRKEPSPRDLAPPSASGHTTS